MTDFLLAGRMANTEDVYKRQIPNHVATIGGFAFADCPLTSVTLGSGVTSIEELAFHQVMQVGFVSRKLPILG